MRKTTPSKSSLRSPWCGWKGKRTTYHNVKMRESLIWIHSHKRILSCCGCQRWSARTPTRRKPSDSESKAMGEWKIKVALKRELKTENVVTMARRGRLLSQNPAWGHLGVGKGWHITTWRWENLWIKYVHTKGCKTTYHHLKTRESLIWIRSHKRM